MFGMSSENVDYLYIKYLKSNILFKSIHLLWLLSFLKLYLPIDVLHVMWDVSYNSFNNSIWELIDYLYDNLQEIDEKYRNNHSFFISNFEAIGIIDASEFFIERPIINQSKYYSGYKKRHTYKYNFICPIDEKILIYVDGPYFGPVDDSDMIKRSGFLKKLGKNEILISDQKYKSVEKVYTELHVNLNSIEFFKKKRVLIENTIGDLKNFECLSNVWRHNIEQHKKVVTIIANFINIKNKS